MQGGSIKPIPKVHIKTHSAPKGIKKIGHIIVIYMENHSFDNLYGEFPGADGIRNATKSEYTQIDTATGNAYDTLPWNDASFHPPTSLPDIYFNIDTLNPPSKKTEDLVHRYYQEQAQINGGKMDKYVAYSDAKGLSMGYYHTADLPMFPIVKEYTLCDRFFHSAFGGSFLNHIYLIAAAPPVFPNAPGSMIATGMLPSGEILDGAVSPDYYGINTLQPMNNPHKNITRDALCPEQTMPTIGDRLDEKHLSWAWYAEGWNLILSGHATHQDSAKSFQYHHQPFNYFAKYGGGSDSVRKEHLKDEDDFAAALKNGTLPAVSFVKPSGFYNEHPGDGNVDTGDTHLVNLIQKIQKSSIWNDCVIVVTYDEHGGFWDHVAPPKIDRWGPGSRVPTIVISPFAKKHFVDHTQYETVSILALIEKRWGLKPLTSRDAKANPFTNALEF